MQKKDIVIILSSILVFVFIWIGFNLYHNSISSTISESVNADITSIVPNFDVKAIAKLKSREVVNPVFQFNQSSNPSTQPSTATPTISTSSAQQASTGGNLLQ